MNYIIEIQQNQTNQPNHPKQTNKQTNKQTKQTNKQTNKTNKSKSSLQIATARNAATHSRVSSRFSYTRKGS